MSYREIERELPGDDDGAVCRRMVDAGMKHRMPLIVPHASRALLVNRAINSKLALATALSMSWTTCHPAFSCLILLPFGPCQCERLRDA